MRTVLVCVRTPLAAQHLSSAAARLGLSAVIRTAVSDPEVMLRIAEQPPDVVLADTALTRPDSAGFVRRVLARAPRAAVLLFGAEESGAAAATISAGARGLIQGADHDLTTAVAKALLLLAASGRSARPVTDPARDAAAVGGGVGRPSVPPPAGGAGRAGGPAAGDAGRSGAAPSGAAGRAGGPSAGGARPGDAALTGGRTVGGPTPGWSATPADPPPGPGRRSAAPAGVDAVVPVQRGDDELDEAAGEPEGRTGPEPGRRPGAGRGGRGGVGLTERELQVLLGMAEGKSNAEIGRELFVSEDTVKTHARRLFRKLGARDRAHAVAAGFRAGLVV
ncbi:response regulator transcription factor [Micromonospora sp. WMMD882]|uniref:response regulator transcription factor n=1 Tax=Micromonospora sp. WMMD882 TaxID=3015151 RepID=UPI00248B78DB|nr:response regulator transcription factor [Micromonospora sp. WMMD882]WBB79238.1 response regulator transcription factor [Micromonospora sp. WMMD882]